MRSKILVIALVALMLIGAASVTVSQAVRQFWHIQVVNVETGCRLNYVGGWKVYGPAYDLLYEGSQAGAVRFLVRNQGCPTPPVTDELSAENPDKPVYSRIVEQGNATFIWGPGRDDGP